MPEVRMKVAPDTVAYADAESHKLVVEFAIPGAPAETIDLKVLEDSVHLTAPTRDIEYVFRAGFRLAGKAAQSRSGLRARPAPN
jgi:HSP20 family molecular chaperone IbpA